MRLRRWCRDALLEIFVSLRVRRGIRISGFATNLNCQKTCVCIRRSAALVFQPVAFTLEGTSRPRTEIVGMPTSNCIRGLQG